MDSIAEYELRREVERQRKASRRRRSGFSRDARLMKIEGKPCRVCAADGVIGAALGWAVEYHHIVPRALFAKGDGDVEQAANAMPLCHAHHQDHHTNPDRRVSRSVLQDDEISFARARMGSGWLDRWYPEEEA